MFIRNWVVPNVCFLGSVPLVPVYTAQRHLQKHVWHRIGHQALQGLWMRLKLCKLCIVQSVFEKLGREKAFTETCKTKTTKSSRGWCFPLSALPRALATKVCRQVIFWILGKKVSLENDVLENSVLRLLILSFPVMQLWRSDVKQLVERTVGESVTGHYL